MTDKPSGGDKEGKPTGGAELLDWIEGPLGKTGLLAFLVSAGLPQLLAFLIRSVTMRYFVQVGALLGALFGYGFARLTKKGIAKAKRRKRSAILAGFLIGTLLLQGFLLWVLRPETTQRFGGIWESLRDLLEDPDYFHPANVIGAALASAGTFLLVYALCMFSPKLDRNS
jgi:hypothetical protein